jgi:hypothetical protein
MRAGVAALWLCGPAVHAQDAQEAQGPRMLFQRGVSALQAQRFSEAVTAFQQSYTLRSSPVVQYNLALALRGAGRHHEAIRAFERYLQSPSPSASPAELAEVRREVERLRAALPTLSLDVSPRNATVQLDLFASAPTVGSVRLDPGPHVLQTTLEGFRTDARRVWLRPEQTLRVRIELERSDGRPRIAVDPGMESAEVEVDGVVLGRGMVERVVEAGTHTVVVRAEGYATERRSVRIGSAGRVRVVVGLRRATGVAPWVIGVSVGAGVAVVGAVVTGVYFATRP